MNRYEKLAAVSIAGKTESKGGLTYLSWAYAWDQLIRQYPDSYFTVYENKDGLNYHTDGKTCWVKVGVTLVDGDYSKELIETLPVMDYRNNSVTLNLVSSTMVNKTIKRCLTKCIALHGIGISLYTGSFDDIPTEKDTPVPPQDAPICEQCGNPIIDSYKSGGEIWYANDIVTYTKRRFGKQLCVECGKKQK